MSQEQDQQKPLAVWSPAMDVWLRGTDPNSALWDVYSETWPTSGTMRNGTVFARRPSEHRTGANGSSS